MPASHNLSGPGKWLQAETLRTLLPTRAKKAKLKDAGKQSKKRKAVDEASTSIAVQRPAIAS